MVQLDPAMVAVLVNAEGLVEMIICNLQLYSITLQVILTYPDEFSTAIMHLHSMHSLMSAT